MQRMGGRLALPELEQLLPELALINDPGLRGVVSDIWNECWHEGSWRSIEDVPKSTQLPERRLVQHTRSVARISLAAAQTLREIHGIPFHRDMLVAAALLHDVSKLVENELGPDGKSSVHSSLGRLVQHGVLGAFKAWQRDLPIELVHAIITHTRSSNVRPQTWEAVIVHYVDYLDSDCLSLHHGRPLLLNR